MDYKKYVKKKAFYDVLAKEAREKWAVINDRFATNDDPAGCKLMATGCMERFNHPRDEERMDKVKSARLEQGSNREQWLENERLSQIETGMSLEQMDNILNPKEYL